MVAELLSRYYGVDVVAMMLTFIGIYTIGNKKRYGFVIALFGNILWAALGVMTESWGLIFANSVLVILYIRAFIKWEDK